MAILALAVGLTGCSKGGSSSRPAPRANPGPSPWGLRNYTELAAVNSLSSAQFQSLFQDHRAGYGAFWLFWSDLEPSQGDYDLGSVDFGLARTAMLSAIPVVVLHLDAPWALGCVSREAICTGPYDLQTGAVAAWPPPPGGYSDVLYALSRELAEHIASKTSGTVYVRVENEAWDEWTLGDPVVPGVVSLEMQSNIDNYLLSYLTVRLAFEEVESETGTIDFRLGHGSIPRGRMLLRTWYAIAEPLSAAGRAPYIQMFKAWAERSRVIDDWADVVALVDLADPTNLRHDFWLDTLIAWTKQGYFDFMTWHPHDKPRFLKSEAALVEMEVGRPLEWVGAETAVAIANPSVWPPQLTGAALERFVMEDFVRKWCTLLTMGSTFMSPVLARPFPQYQGLFTEQGGLAPLPANAAFVRLSERIGRPERVEILDESTHAVYRFDRSTDGRVVDAVWLRSLFDDDNSTANVTVPAPSGYSNVRVEDALGNVLGSFRNVASLTLAVGQPPRILVWE